MLWETWQYLTTPCPRHARKLGYLRELIGIASRHRRLRDAWQPHLQQTREFILESAQACVRRDHAMILGSGWLLDVPWPELARQFGRVSLVDLIHPRAVRKQVRAFSNVHCVTTDLTGLTQSLFERPDRRPESLPAPRRMDLSSPQPVDYLVSANVLSQLPILPLEFLDPVPASEWAAGILQQHLELLQSARCPAVLVTDTEALTFDRQGDVTRREDLLHGVKLPAPQREWTWQLAPFGEVDAQHRTEHRVVAIRWSR